MGDTNADAGGHERRDVSRLSHIRANGRDNIVGDFDLSIMSVDSRGNIVPKRTQAALVAAQT
jgi:hypothetical protein